MKLIEKLKSMPSDLIIRDGADDWSIDNLIDALSPADLERECYFDGIGIYFFDTAGIQESIAAYQVILPENVNSADRS